MWVRDQCIVRASACGAGTGLTPVQKSRREGLVPARLCACALLIQAETLMPALAAPLLEPLPAALLVEDPPPRKFRIICSLLLALRLSVTCCAF